jgi:4-amino-4-deoxy-L-arabinose transferase-like glycosyltransferase
MTNEPSVEPMRRTHPALGLGVVVTGLVVLVAAFHLLTVRDGVGWSGDGYQYLLHAENIAEGRPYADTGYIHNPDRYIAPVAYPAGFPLLLAPVVALFGMSVQAVIVLLTLVWAATVAALAFLFRHELPAPFVYGLVLVVGLQPYLWELKHAPLSDLPFLLGVVLSLLCYDRAVRAERDEAGPGRWAGLAALAGVSACYALATRPLGLLLVPTFLAYDLVRARRPTRPFVIAAVSCVALYGVFAALVDLDTGARVVQAGGAAGSEASGGYGALVRIAILQQLGDVPRHVVERLVDYARATFVFWHVPQPGGAVAKNVLMALSLIPVGIGFGHRVRRRFGVVEAFFVLYALSLLPWSFGRVRYLLPLIPFYYFYLFVGLERMQHTLQGGRALQGRRLARGVTVAAAVAFVAVYGLRYGPLLLSDSAAPGLEELAQDPTYVYLRERTPPSAVMITSGDPRGPTFFARRAASAAPRDVREWGAFAERLGASYALVSGRTRREVRAQVPPSRLRLVASSESRDLYRIVPPPRPGEPHGRE